MGPDSRFFKAVLNRLRAIGLLALALALEGFGAFVAVVVFARMLALVDLVYRTFHGALRLLVRLVHVNSPH